jgi:excisionase family DNA binding protein
MNKKLTVEQAARYLGVSSKTLRRWEANGYLIPKRTSGLHRRYTEEQLLELKDKKYSRDKVKKLDKQMPSAIFSDDQLQTPVNANSVKKIQDLFPKNAVTSNFKNRISAVLSYLASFNRRKKAFLGGMFLILLLVSLITVSKKNIFVSGQTSSEKDGLVYSQQTSRAVLGEATDPGFTFKVNVPAEFGKQVTFSNGVIIDSGAIKAPNIVYSIKSGTGITITTGQNPIVTNAGLTSLSDSTGDIDLGSGLSISSNTLSNSDRGSSQSIFKNIKIGGSTISAGSNTDALEFAAGTGITLAANTTDKKITITAESSGWTAGTGYTSLKTVTDSVGIGITVPTSRLHVVGSTNLAGGVTLGSLTSDTISYIGRVASDILPSASGTYSLGSDSYRWSQLYLTGVVAVGGQATFTSSPTGTGVGQGAIYINPPSVADNSYTLFGIAVNGTEKLRMDATGNIAVQGNFLGPTTGSVGYWTRSATTLSPYTTGDSIFTTGSIGAGTPSAVFKLSVVGVAGLSPFNVASSSGTSLFNVAANGNIGIGTTNPGLYKVNVVGADAGTTNYVFNFQNSTGTRYINMRNDGTFLSNQILSFSGGFGIDSFSSGAKIIFETGGMANGNITIDGSTSNGTIGSIELKAKATTGSVYVSQGNFGVGTSGPDAKLDVLSGGGGTQLRLTSTDESMYSDFITNQMGNLLITPSGGLATFSGRLSLGTGGSRTYATGSDDFFVVGDIENDGLIYSPEIRSNNFRLLGASIISGTNLNPVSYGDQAYNLKFRTNLTDNIVYMSQLGNVGVGTSTPYGRLEVTGTSSHTNALAILNETGSNDIFTASVSGVTKFLINNSGKVGIGTTNMTSALNVNGSITTVGYNSFQGDTGKPAYIAGNASGSIQSAMSSVVIPYNQYIINTSGISMGIQSLPKFGGNGTYANQNGTYIAIGIMPIYNQLSGSGSNTDLLINRTETLLTTGAQYLIDAQVGGASRFSVTNKGFGYFADDFLIGSQATSSALFSVSGISTRQPIASLSGNLIVMQNNGWGGNVGIRNANPAYALDVNGSMSMGSNNTIYSNATDGAYKIFSFSRNGAERLSLAVGTEPIFSTPNGSFQIASRLGVNTAYQTEAQAYITSGAVGVVGAVIQGASGQTADLMRWKSSTATLGVINSLGRVGLGTAAASFRLDVFDTQVATGTAMFTNSSTNTDADVMALKIAGTTAGTGNSFLTFLNGNGEIIGKVNGNGSGGVSYGTTGIDFAEYFPKTNKEEELQVGTLICNKDGGATACNLSSNAILGVVSDRAGFIGGTQHQDNPSYVAVGLVGQLRVKISNSNGEIKAGDPLTFSDTLGVAAKATARGYILGHALENSTDGNGSTREMIMANVSPSFYDPSAQVADNSTADIIKSLSDRVAYLENLISIRASASAGLDELISHNPVRGDASSSAELFKDIEVENLTLNHNATILGNLIVGGRTVVNDLGITGNLTLGTVNVKPDGQINALGQDLKLQSDQTGGIDILAGKITIGKDGIATFGENAIFEKDVMIRGVLSADSIEVASQSAGSATIQVGESSVKIDSLLMKSTSKVLITPNTLIDVPLSVLDKKEGSFTVQLKKPQSESINFDWLIIR